MFLDFR